MHFSAHAVVMIAAPVAGVLLLLTYKWLSVRLWFYWAYARRYGFGATVRKREAYIPADVRRGFRPVGYTLVVLSAVLSLATGAGCSIAAFPAFVCLLPAFAATLELLSEPGQRTCPTPKEALIDADRSHIEDLTRLIERGDAVDDIHMLWRHYWRARVRNRYIAASKQLNPAVVQRMRMESGSDLSFALHHGGADTILTRRTRRTVAGLSR